jgi:hypothetical protein
LATQRGVPAVDADQIHPFILKNWDSGMKTTRKPNSAMTAHHHSAIVTARHAARMRAGRVESRPEDYADIAVTEQAKRLREARRAIEERNMLRELGLG